MSLPTPGKVINKPLTQGRNVLRNVANLLKEVDNLTKRA